MDRIPKSIKRAYWCLVLILAGLLLWQLLGRGKSPARWPAETNPAEAYQFALNTLYADTYTFIDYILETDYLRATQEQSDDAFLGAYDIWYRDLNAVRWLTYKKDAAEKLWLHLLQEVRERYTEPDAPRSEKEAYRLQALCTFLSREPYYSALSQERQGRFDRFLIAAKEGKTENLSDSLWDRVELTQLPSVYETAPLFCRSEAPDEALLQQIRAQLPELTDFDYIRIYHFSGYEPSEDYRSMEVTGLIPVIENGRIIRLYSVTRMENGKIMIPCLEREEAEGSLIQYLEYLSPLTGAEKPLTVLSAEGSFYFLIGDKYYIRVIGSLSNTEVITIPDYGSDTETIRLPIGE